MRYKLFSLGLVLFCGLMATSCKNELQQVAGEYSYKISGSAMVDSAEVRLTNETGALHIIDKDEKELLLTFNMLGGDVYTALASLDNKELSIRLERCAMQVSAIAAVAESEEDPAAFREATVLAVNRELETAVLSVGTVHGVFPGLIYQDRGGSGQSLRIVSVRPWVSAAVPVGGNAEQITPGMRFTVEHRAQPGERISPLRMR